jgi:putative two-component system response regulator
MHQSAGKILVVDDTPANVMLLTRLLGASGYDVVSAADGRAALAAVEREAPELVLLDVMMPELNGFDVCRALKQNPATRLVPVVLVTASSERDDKIRGINAGADDFLTKPVNAAELKARVRSLLRLKRYTDDLDSAESVILSLALTVEARDPGTHGHCQRLAAYASALGRRIGCPADDLAALHRGGYLHDIGKIAVPDSVLLKPTRLEPSEYELIKQHPAVGERLCGDMRVMRRVRPIIRHHHERLDGSGYPDGLKGDEIPLLAQVIAVADVYDALTTDRPYRKALTPEAASAELRREVQLGWRRQDLVEEFLEMVADDAIEVPESIVTPDTDCAHVSAP